MKSLTKRKLALKARVLAHSSASAKKDGMAALTVDTVMRGVDRTSSSFYTVFGSKAQLLQAVVESELALSVERFSGARRPLEPFGEWMQKVRNPPSQDPIDDWVENVLRPYLCSYHVATPSAGCALPALSTDIARLGTEARAAYEDAMEKIVESCLRRTGCSDTAAWAVVAQCVGAIIVARALTSDNGREVLLKSSADFIRTALKNEAGDAGMPRQARW